MNSSSNPFERKLGRKQFTEALQKFGLLLITYSIIAFTLLIFSVIIFKGAPVLYSKGLDFLTRKPETLEVIAFDEGKNIQIPTESFETLRTYNPPNQDNPFIANDTAITKDFSYTQFDLMPNSLVGDGYLSDIEKYASEHPAFVSRHTDKPVGFTLPKDSFILITPETHKELVAQGDAFTKIEAKEFTKTVINHQVTFPKGECTIPAKTVALLQGTKLVYWLYANLRDKTDDEPNYPMPVDFREQQTVLLSDDIYESYQEAPGTSTVLEAKEISTDLQLISLTIPAGHYTLPFDLFRKVVQQNDSINVAHGHNLDKGVIELGHSDPLKVELPTSLYATILQDNPGIIVENVSEVTKTKDYVSFDFLRACEIQLPTTDMTALRKANEGSDALAVLNEHVHPYSAGGVSGPMIGTALLVICCMSIALFLGVAAAVFLGEYSKQGGLITTIRLAMMNLAGVPSIVFGIFGLGLFVILAPKLTDTPSVQDKVQIPVFPSFSEPELRTQEYEKIVILSDTENKDDQVNKARLDGQARFYDGKYYLSFEGWGTSVLAGAFTLAIMVLPIIITSSEESLRAVPQGFREASLALGATKWQSIRTAVLPYATPGILTASVLGITRVAGETAPIMFTAAVAQKSNLPFNGLPGSGFDKFLNFISQNVQAMPYHIYTVSGKIPQSEYNKPMQWGSVLVFMIVVMIFASLSIWLRIRMRKKYKW